MVTMSCSTNPFHLSYDGRHRGEDVMWQRVGDVLQMNRAVRIQRMILFLNQLNGALEKQILFLSVPVLLSKSLKLIFHKFYVYSTYL